MVRRPAHLNAFEFVVVSRLRAAQVMRGCTPHVPHACKATTTAQLEVAAGFVTKLADPAAPQGTKVV